MHMYPVLVPVPGLCNINWHGGECSDQATDHAGTEMTKNIVRESICREGNDCAYITQKMLHARLINHIHVHVHTASLIIGKRSEPPSGLNRARCHDIHFSTYVLYFRMS